MKILDWQFLDLGGIEHVAPAQALLVLLQEADDGVEEAQPDGCVDHRHPRGACWRVAQGSHHRAAATYYMLW